MPEQVRVVGLVAAMGRERAVAEARSLAAALAAAGVEVRAEPELAQECGLPCGTLSRSEVVAGDLVVVLGGDGTLLGAAREAAPRGTPLLGVDLGGFGFLAETHIEELYDRLEAVLAGSFDLDARMMLEVRVTPQAGEPSRSFGLNEAVVSRGAVARMARLRLEIDGRPVAHYPADGLIVATATGSTAYTLAAGGPVVDPAVECVVITPICPHTLYSRPTVIAATSEVTVRVETSRGAPDDGVVIVDGQVETVVRPGDTILVRRAPFAAKLVRITESSFVSRLRSKLNWGVSR